MPLSCDAAPRPRRSDRRESSYCSACRLSRGVGCWRVKLGRCRGGGRGGRAPSTVASIEGQPVNGKRQCATKREKVPDASGKITFTVRMEKTVAALQQALTKPRCPR